VRRSAGGAGAIPFSFSFASTKASIDAPSIFRSGLNAQTSYAL
jgi:hypothetical protein